MSRLDSVLSAAWLGLAAAVLAQPDPPPPLWQLAFLATGVPVGLWLVRGLRGGFAHLGQAVVFGPLLWSIGLLMLLLSDADSMVRVRLVEALALDRVWANPTVVPAGHTPTRHEHLKRMPRSASVIFLGDSLTARWYFDGRRVWERQFAPRRAAAFGVGGDRIQNLLWRLCDGELDGTTPRAVVLLIGTNNIGHDAPDRIVAGIAAVVEQLHARLPDTVVIVHGLLPRGRAGDPVRQRVAAVNSELAAMPNVMYLDCGDVFLTGSGEWRPGTTTDGLHLTEAGYALWATALESVVGPFLDQPE